jgi:hypothetical protein
MGQRGGPRRGAGHLLAGSSLAERPVRSAALAWPEPRGEFVGQAGQFHRALFAFGAQFLEDRRTGTQFIVANDDRELRARSVCAAQLRLEGTAALTKLR